MVTSNMKNVIFILGVLWLGYIIFGGTGMLIAGLVLLMRGDKREE